MAVDPVGVGEVAADAAADTDKFIAGKLAGGTHLPFDYAKVVHHGNTVSDGPFGRIKETIGGCITVRAESIDEAVAFAKGCPVLKGEGNTVEVRLIARNL